MVLEESIGIQFGTDVMIKWTFYLQPKSKQKRCELFAYVMECWWVFVLQQDKCQYSSEVVPNYTTTSAPINHTYSYTTQQPLIGRNKCTATMIASFVVLSILHSIAFGYALYSKRFKETEHFNSLLERVRYRINQPGNQAVSNYQDH